MSAFQLNLTSWSFQNLSNLPLKLLTDWALTTLSGNLFHRVLTLLEKQNLWRSYLTWSCLILYVLPIVNATGMVLNYKVTSLSCLLVIILYNSIISPLILCRRYFKFGRFNICEGSYLRFLVLGWQFSGSHLNFLGFFVNSWQWGDQTQLAYSKCEWTRDLYNVTKQSWCLLTFSFIWQSNFVHCQLTNSWKQVAASTYVTTASICLTRPLHVYVR